MFRPRRPDDAQEEWIEQDKDLRDHGYPQSLICLLRAGGVTYDAIRNLPAPAYDEVGTVSDEYFVMIRDHFNIPTQALPISMRSPPLSGNNSVTASTVSMPTGRDLDLRVYGSQVVHTFNTPSKSGSYRAHPDLSFSQKFGSPVRALPSFGTSPLVVTPPNTVNMASRHASQMTSAGAWRYNEWMMHSQ